MLEKLKSRKFLAMIVGVVVVPLLVELLGMDEVTAVSVAGVISAYILGQSAVDVRHQ